MKFLSIDPSINNVGWTTFDTSLINAKKHTAGWAWGTFALEGFNKIQRMADLYQSLLNEGINDIDHLVIEYPAFYSGQRGQIAAHNNYTIDLAHICGYIAGRFGSDHRSYHAITAIEWKGTVSKEITARKFFRLFKVPLSTISEHAVDSTMLLRYFLITYGRVLLQRHGETLPVSPLLPAEIFV